ncbi:hypothetical protein [Leptospira santarosai]|uniref:Uncharacterized protein n=1 Tax=Leptospira santarosai TaxID=28183 RepID=A0AB73LMV1_9LEPT|nr:hypothetical protein [Leptospira santarosai]OLY62438.1 hypothetical protein BWD11_20180 [Leptospira santarosai serovar Grippotyphosa]OLY64289.1 hypothetical protein BWD11_09460 [Leptospira santarosai serovar Grippotyphosa]ONF75761.1 hypothetical protein BWD12_20055 [Leptospira santarosai serovar Bananal]ONF77990.1 hypothetical protein BWD12_13315 [Leptospira santarosai serovar Bananal]ONF83241.1 hypothetical protein BWD13_19145 [Leptospira santarosai serovar Grippotyphosa]
MGQDVLFSKKLAFSAENILNPQTNEVLFETSVPKSAYNLPGNLEFTVVSIKLKPTQKQKIKSILWTLSQNYSYVRKSYIPVQWLNFFGTSDPSLAGILKNFSDSEILSSAVTLDGVSVANIAAARTLNFKTEISDKVASNRLRFSSFGPNYDFLFAPRNNASRSIFDNIEPFFSVSMTDSLDSQIKIPIPRQYEYLLIFPYASSPTPVSKSQTKSNISISSLLNLIIEED